MRVYICHTTRASTHRSIPHITRPSTHVCSPTVMWAPKVPPVPGCQVEGTRWSVYLPCGGYLVPTIWRVPTGLNVEGHQVMSLNVLYVPWGLRDGQVGQRIVLRDTMGTSLDVPYVLYGLRDGMDRWDSTMECPILYVP